MYIKEIYTDLQKISLLQKNSFISLEYPRNLDFDQVSLQIQSQMNGYNFFLQWWFYNNIFPNLGFSISRLFENNKLIIELCFCLANPLILRILSSAFAIFVISFYLYYSFNLYISYSIFKFFNPIFRISYPIIHFFFGISVSLFS